METEWKIPAMCAPGSTMPWTAMATACLTDATRVPASTTPPTAIETAYRTGV
jgi:hypothetical protein